MLRVGVVGATGMVGQRFITLLDKHPDFRVTLLAASAASAGKAYAAAVAGRWAMTEPIPEHIGTMCVRDAAHVASNAKECDFVFCAIVMSKLDTLRLEEAYAREEVPVVSSNSAARMVADVPMLIPEINTSHLAVIAAQRRRLRTQHGFIAVKPNCSIQSYVPALHTLLTLGGGLTAVAVCTYQAVSGAGRTLDSWPEMVDNVIPFISGEDDKSEREPFKIWGTVDEQSGSIVAAKGPAISAQCARVPVSDGHLAAVFLRFADHDANGMPVAKPTREQIIASWRAFSGRPQQLHLHSAPAQFLTYFDDDDRPQSKLDRDQDKGMGICVGRLRPDSSGVFDYKFACLSHNTLRGAAGGSVLTAELLKAEGFLVSRV